MALGVLKKVILNSKNEDGSFLMKDFIVIGYIDPRGKEIL